MKISYNWLKWYIPDAPPAEKLSDVFTLHICEVESVTPLLGGEGAGGEVDTIFDLKILPNRAHDLLSHQGIARELASLLNIKFVDPTPKYKVPESKPTKLIKKIESSKCRRYMGRIIRNVKIAPSPEWMVKYLEAIGQRSINNIVDATNIVMFDCGQPAHVFDMSKVKDLKLQVRNANNGEKITLLGGGEKVLTDNMMIIADDYGNALDIAGIKGGTYAELNKDTTDVILECANFDPTSVRKTAQALNIFTDARKRFENDLSPELAEYGIKELSALIYEMCPEASFEDVVDIYPKKAEKKRVSVSVNYINKRLGSNFSKEEIESVWKKLNFEYTEKDGEFEIKVPFLRVDITGPHDLAEDIISVLGYDRLEEKLPEIKLKSKINETFAKMLWARNKLLNDGYSEVMNSSFCNSGEVEVLASASDKNFLRTNLTDGLKESLKLNQTNAPLLGINEIKIFEIGTIFKKSGSSFAQGFGGTKEEMRVAYGDKKGIKEMTLEEFYSPLPEYPLGGGEYPPRLASEPPLKRGISPRPDGHRDTPQEGNHFKMWSLFPFIARDIAVWTPENVKSFEVERVIKENAGEMVARGPELFDEFKKDGKISYAFRLVFQSYERTLTDTEVNEIMNKITEKIKENKDWQAR